MKDLYALYIDGLMSKKVKMNSAPFMNDWKTVFPILPVRQKNKVVRKHDLICYIFRLQQASKTCGTDYAFLYASARPR